LADVKKSRRKPSSVLKPCRNVEEQIQNSQNNQVIETNKTAGKIL